MHIIVSVKKEKKKRRCYLLVLYYFIEREIVGAVKITSEALGTKKKKKNK